MNYRLLPWCLASLVAGCSSTNAPIRPTAVEPAPFIRALAIDPPCFAPLTTPLSTDPMEWKDLVQYKVKVEKAKHVKRFLTLEKDGEGEKFNLDYFALSFKPPPGAKLDEFFKQMRLAFPIYAGATKENVFRAYAVKYSDPKDAVRKANDDLWAKSKHEGALMTFLLTGMALSSSMFTDLENRWIAKRVYGDVQSVCSSPTDFIFSTVESDTDVHPVSGFRGFGLKSNVDGTWTFYSKAADRRTRGNPPNEIFKRTGAEYFDVFRQGRFFWGRFYKEMRTQLGQIEGVSNVGNLVANCNIAVWKGTSMEGITMEACPALPK